MWKWILPLLFSVTAQAAIPFGFIHRTVFPRGIDGPKIVNGGSVTLPTGTVKDYNQILVLNGSSLETTGTNGAWVILGCSGPLVIDDVSQMTNTSRDDTGGISPPPITATTPDGHSLSYSPTASLSGGYGGGGESGLPGGIPQAGNGGGGGAANNSGNDAGATTGGQGGAGNQCGTGGLGGSGWGASGENGGSASENGNDVAACGGGGGTKGLNGGGTSLTVAGPVLLTGAINCSGQQGGSGGNGGDADGDSEGEYYISAGGGAGGGDGGSGGKCDFRFRGVADDLNGNIFADGGDSGGGGFGGTSTDAGTPTGGGDNGDDGQIGDAGVVAISTLPY